VEGSETHRRRKEYEIKSSKLNCELIRKGRAGERALGHCMFSVECTWMK
jgi:hypothetical protein